MAKNKRRINDLELPKIEVPRIEIPRIEVQRIEIPDFKEYERIMRNLRRLRSL